MPKHTKLPRPTQSLLSSEQLFITLRRNFERHLYTPGIGRNARALQWLKEKGVKVHHGMKKTFISWWKRVWGWGSRAVSCMPDTQATPTLSKGPQGVGLGDHSGLNADQHQNGFFTEPVSWVPAHPESLKKLDQHKAPSKSSTSMRDTCLDLSKESSKKSTDNSYHV